VIDKANKSELGQLEQRLMSKLQELLKKVINAFVEKEAGEQKAMEKVTRKLRMNHNRTLIRTLRVGRSKMVKKP
jgi:hypothetical protein